jgi:hypothetical protein
MKLRLAATLTIGALLIAPACFAQNPSGIPGSGQGGYLGINPGAAPPPVSSQMGALQAPPVTATANDWKSSPTAWCVNSPDPSRCRARSEIENQICASKQGDSYAHCRFAVDQMHGN